MKKYILIFLFPMFIFLFQGCSKDSFDPAAQSQDSFIGTWKGTITTFKNNKQLIEYSTIDIYPDAGGQNLSGIIFMQETYVFHEFQFNNGSLYFNVENNDPDNPFCQSWNLSGYAIFSNENEIEVHITGNECGDLGGEFINWSGTLSSAEVVADSIRYYDFAKNGNSWSYAVTLKNGTACQIQKQISSVPSVYVFGGTYTQSCGWNGQNPVFTWEVTPDHFSIVSDSTLCNVPFKLAINAKKGVVYSSYNKNDTTTITLLDTVSVSTPAGNFTCTRFRYTEPVYSGTQKTTVTSYLWLNNRYGIIMQEVVNPVHDTDIQAQVLASKSF
jgi:hypothetical protein